MSFFFALPDHFKMQQYEWLSMNDLLALILATPFSHADQDSKNVSIDFAMLEIYRRGTREATKIQRQMLPQFLKRNLLSRHYNVLRGFLIERLKVFDFDRMTLNVFDRTNVFDYYADKLSAAVLLLAKNSDRKDDNLLLDVDDTIINEEQKNELNRFFKEEDKMHALLFLTSDAVKCSISSHLVSFYAWIEEVGEKKAEEYADICITTDINGMFSKDFSIILKAILHCDRMSVDIFNSINCVLVEKVSSYYLHEFREIALSSLRSNELPVKTRWKAARALMNLADLRQVSFKNDEIVTVIFDTWLEFFDHCIQLNPNMATESLFYGLKPHVIESTEDQMWNMISVLESRFEVNDCFASHLIIDMLIILAHKTKLQNLLMLERKLLSFLHMKNVSPRMAALGLIAIYTRNPKMYFKNSVTNFLKLMIEKIVTFYEKHNISIECLKLEIESIAFFFNIENIRYFPGVAEILFEKVDSQHIYVQSFVIYCLGKIAERVQDDQCFWKIQEVLWRKLSDDNIFIRWMAVEALSRLAKRVSEEERQIILHAFRSVFEDPRSGEDSEEFALKVFLEVFKNVSMLFLRLGQCLNSTIVDEIFVALKSMPQDTWLNEGFQKCLMNYVQLSVKDYVDHNVVKHCIDILLKVNPDRLLNDLLDMLNNEAGLDIRQPYVLRCLHYVVMKMDSHQWRAVAEKLLLKLNDPKFQIVMMSMDFLTSLVISAAEKNLDFSFLKDGLENDDLSPQTSLLKIMLGVADQIREENAAKSCLSLKS